ncbi:carboxypeptidase-like regulatory domain-containing protein, partial [uncultured Duncaniella sp.]
MLLALCSLAVRGQVSVTGKVRDAAGKDALAGAVVRVYSGGKLKAYASVGSDGDYRLKVPALAVDSLDVTVQCIGFSTVKRRIANRSAVVDFRLPAASTELREVSVSVPRINILGDTLVYN